MNGMKAIEYLSGLTERVSLHSKDNTDKFWSYKMKTGRRIEFAFDPNTTTKLVIRADSPFPEIDGIKDVKSLKGESVSTALNRVFSGGVHVARFKATIETLSTLKKLLEHYETSK